MDSPEETLPVCNTCGKAIPQANFELHSLRCRNGNRPASTPSRPASLLFVVVALVLIMLVYCVYSLIQWWIYLSNAEPDYGNYPGFHAHVWNKLLGDRGRQSFLDRMPPSFLPDVWPESSFAWTRIFDNFWTPILNLPLKDRSQLVMVSELSPAESQKFKEDFLAMVDRLDKFSWQALSPAQGVCGHKENRTICAVHRWNSVANNRMMGRVQCWTDASLLHSEPQFVYQNSLFHPAFVNASISLCVVDIPGYAATVMAPLPFLQINNLAWQCESNYDHNVQIRPDDLPADVMRGFQPYFFQFLDGYLMENDFESDDEGEVIDLDVHEL